MENITDSLKNIKSGMVVTAHPDDAEYGCSGTVAKLANNGSDMVYVLCTDGSKGTEDKNLSPEKLAKIRNTEQLRMCFDGSLNFLIISEITTKTVGTRIAIPAKPSVNIIG